MNMPNNPLPSQVSSNQVNTMSATGQNPSMGMGQNPQMGMNTMGNQMGGPNPNQTLLGNQLIRPTNHSSPDQMQIRPQQIVSI